MILSVGWVYTYKFTRMYVCNQTSKASFEMDAVFYNICFVIISSEFCYMYIFKTVKDWQYNITKHYTFMLSCGWQIMHHKKKYIYLVLNLLCMVGNVVFSGSLKTQTGVL